MVELGEAVNYVGTERRIMVGDKVSYSGRPGLIVFVISDNSFSERYPEVWSTCATGIGVELQEGEWRGTLFELPEPDEDLEPIVE